MGERLKVALVYRHFNERGSIERQHVGLARYLVGRGHTVHVYSIAATSEPELVPGIAFHDVPTAHLGSPWSLRELLAYDASVRSALVGQQFDCIHGRVPSSRADIVHVPGVAKALRGEVSRVRYAASLVRNPGDIGRLAMERRAIRDTSAKLFHVDTPQVKEDLVSSYGIDPRRIEVIPHAINLDLFVPLFDKAPTRRALGLPEEGIVILFCGHDFHRKGLDRAIAALALMKHPATLAVVGKRDPEPFLRQAERLQVRSQILLFGERSDTHLFHQAADILVLPSRFELWGVPVIEAMATAVPPVVTGGVGAASVVSETGAGIVLDEPLSVPEFAAALDRLAASPELRADLGERGVRAAADYSWDAVGARVLTAIRAVASGSAAADTAR